MLSKTFHVNAGWSDVYAMNVLPVPEAVAAEFLAKDAKRCICKIADMHWPCALLSGGEKYGYFILLNKKRREVLGNIEEELIEVTLTEDISEYGMPLPEEWAEILEFDDEAATIFAQLTPGRQRSILHMVGSPKREETRITRALRIADNLKMGAREIKDFMKK